MNKSIFIKYFIILLIFTSCGYQKAEKDKHPDIPLFPNHTNNKISIKQFTFESHHIKYSKNNFFIYNSDNKLIILDRKFNKIKEISPSVISNNISKDGTMYFIEDNENPELIETYKRSIKNNFKKEKIINLTIKSREGVTIRDSLNSVFEGKSIEKDSVKFNKLIDSLTNLTFKKEEEEVLFKLKQLKENLISIFPLSYSVSILKYENKEIALYTSYDHTFEFKNVLEKTRLNGLQDIWRLEKSPKSFDKVVLGNSFSGNHYVGGYTPYGYNYVELTLNNETTKFKASNSNNGDGVNILYENNDTIVLKDSQQLYYITLKK